MFLNKSNMQHLLIYSIIDHSPWWALESILPWTLVHLESQLLSPTFQSTVTEDNLLSQRRETWSFREVQAVPNLCLHQIGSVGTPVSPAGSWTEGSWPLVWTGPAHSDRGLCSVGVLVQINQKISQKWIHNTAMSYMCGSSCMSHFIGRCKLTKFKNTVLKSIKVFQVQ